MRKTILGIMVIVATVGFLIWGGYFDYSPKKTANIFYLEQGLQGKWSDVKKENAVYFFSNYTFAWQRNLFESIIGTYKIIRMNEKQLFLKLELQFPGPPVIKIYKFILTGTYDGDNRFASFTLEPLKSEPNSNGITLRREREPDK